MKFKFTNAFLLLLPLLLCRPALQAQLVFSSADSLFAYADRHSTSSRISAQQSLLAKWTKVAALANTLNYKSPIAFSATNNLLLPVNFLPAETFGGPAGTFREITLGQQYVSNLNVNPQIDLINPQNWARLRSAEISKEMTEVTNRLNKKYLHESIAAAFYNCLSLNEQLRNTERSLQLADSLLAIVSHKQSLGIARGQDVNNARVNSLGVQDRLQQLQLNREQQINALKVLCDIPANTPLSITEGETAKEEALTNRRSTLEADYQQLQNQYLKSELNAGRLSMLPVLSLVYYQGWQHNSNTGFSDSEAKWIPSRYIGLRITVPFPPDVTKLSQNYTSKINYRISALNMAHVQLQNELGNRSLDLDVEKYSRSFKIAEEIAELKNSNYEKSLNQYREGILAADLLLTAFSDLLNARTAVATARANRDYARTKLIINNSLQ